MSGAEVFEGELVAPQVDRGGIVRAMRARVLRAVEGTGVRWPRAVAAVLAVLASHADAEGTCFPSQETIAAAACYSVRHVARAIDVAEEAGLLLRAVPRVGARLLGTATVYSLPWYAVTAQRGLAGASKVIAARKRGPIAQPSAGVVASILDALERADPLAVVRRTAARLSPTLQREVLGVVARDLFSGAEGWAPKPSGLRTQGPDKTSREIASRNFDGGAGLGKDDRRPSAGEKLPKRPIEAVNAAASRILDALGTRKKPGSS